MNDNDYYEFNKYHVLEGFAVKKSLFVLLNVFLLIFIGVLLIIEKQEWNEFHGIMMAMLITLFVLNMFSKKIRLKVMEAKIKRLKKSGKIFDETERTITFADDLITDKTQEAEAKLKYTTLERTAVGDKAVYIYLTVNQAIIIPIRVFNNEQEQNDFLNFINDKIKNNQVNI